MDEGYVENSLQRWFIKAWERLPGMCWMHLRCGNNPNDNKTLIPGIILSFLTDTV